MKFFLLSPTALDPWYWDDCEKGIGGCEQAVCEMSWRLARRGHEVTVYATPPWNKKVSGDWRGVSWQHYAAADFSQPGVWVLHRCPEFSNNLFFPGTDSARQIVWMLVKDWDYDCTNLSRMDRVLVLCRMHKTWLEKRHPELSSKMHLTSHGVRVDLIDQIGASTRGYPVRDPRKIVYASSPDRGLLELLTIFSMAQTGNDLRLHVFYGFDGLERLVEKHPNCKPLLACKGPILDLASKIPGVHMHGRVSQEELYREFLSAAMIVYPTVFAELTWGSGLEAQACGAIPITSMYWAQWENNKHGVVIAGNPGSPEVQNRFAGQIRTLSRNPVEQDRIRQRMIPHARQAYDWETVVTQWINYAEEDYARHGNDTLPRVRESASIAGS